MTDIPVSAQRPALFPRLRQYLRARHREQRCRTDLTRALAELGATELRDIGLTWDDVLAARRAPVDKDAARTLARAARRT